MWKRVHLCIGYSGIYWRKGKISSDMWNLLKNISSTHVFSRATLGEVPYYACYYWLYHDGGRGRDDDLGCNTIPAAKYRCHGLQMPRVFSIQRDDLREYSLADVVLRPSLRSVFSLLCCVC